MLPNLACAGECIYEDFRLEYQVVGLEFINKKLLKIEAICYNPYNQFDKEAIFKFTTNNLNSQDERLKIAFSIMDSVIDNLKLDKHKLYKLIVKDQKVYYICKI